MSIEQMLELGISTLRSVHLEEKIREGTTLGGLRVGRNVYWFRTQIAAQRGSGWAYIIGFRVWIRICLHLVELHDLRKR
jgi:hypothetical protein